MALSRVMSQLVVHLHDFLLFRGCFLVLRVIADNSIFSRSRMKTFPRHLDTHVCALRCLSPRVLLSRSAEFTVSRKILRTSKKSQCTASRRVHSTGAIRTVVASLLLASVQFSHDLPGQSPRIRVSLSLIVPLRSPSLYSRDYAIKVVRTIIETRTRAFRRSKSVAMSDTQFAELCNCSFAHSSR